MKQLKIGVIGLGQRGASVLYNILLKNPQLEVTFLCDKYQDRINNCKAEMKKLNMNEPESGTNYKKFLDKSLMDAVYIATSWETHISVAVDFLKAGIPVALEVGGAGNLEELFELVETQEKTKTPFMFMENCCYDKNEMMAYNMARAGIFGEIVHCSGAYSHDLRFEITTGSQNRHYRQNHYLNENCENYPTHELGPIAKILNINNGNRMISLVSVASKAAGLEAYVKENPDKVDKNLIGKSFKQGDIVHTIITCENGETILLKLDTTLPRSYDREFTVRGTKGLYNQTLHTVFLDGDKEDFNVIDFHLKTINNAVKYEDEYLPDIWKNITDEERATGHGGMDGFMFQDFIDALLNKTKMPIDVYDAAAWMCISCLSAQSINSGGASVVIPDFTNGKYKKINN